jgi:RNA polymerase sigma-70 factor (ECF subfamily)
MAMDNVSDDKQLIEQAKKDISRFTPLYEKYVDTIYRYCYNRVNRNKDLAEDLTSEVFVKALDNFDSFTYEGKPFVTWLYRISHNLIVDYFKAKKNQNVSFDSLLVNPPDETEGVLDNLSKEEYISEIQKSLTELPPKANEVIALKHIEEYTFKQIGDILGKSESAVKMQYYRALEMVKHIMQKHVT